MLGGFSFFYIIKLVEYWKIYNLTKKKLESYGDLIKIHQLLLNIIKRELVKKMNI